MSLAQQKLPQFDETVQYQAFPLQKGQILVRVENIQDRFDKAAASKTVNLASFAKNFWSLANNGSDAPTPKIRETMLDGVKDKLKKEWYSQKKDSFEEVELSPMGIKSFVIDFN